MVLSVINLSFFMVKMNFFGIYILVMICDLWCDFWNNVYYRLLINFSFDWLVIIILQEFIPFYFTWK